MTIPEWYITTKFAEDIANKICAKVIRVIQKIESRCGLDPLENCWDDICVQVQSNEFITWNLYEDFVTEMILPYVEKLKKHEKQCLWLETGEGNEWYGSNEEKKYGEIPFCIDDIIQYLKTNYIYTEASDWSNKRIREFLGF